MVSAAPWVAVLLGLSTSVASASGALPRHVRIDGQRFIFSSTNTSIVLSGPNVVVKGPPYLPAVRGVTHCHDVVNSNCSATGTCKTCYTFNEADINLIKSQGRNFIRLGVVWAGAQPRDEDALDIDFLERLHAILDLADRTGIHVMLDNHGDMTASAACGNGAPMWVSQKAAPHLIGKPLKTGFPFDLIDSLKISNLGGYDHCSDNETKWAAFAGDPNYNLLNECCLAINGGNPAATGFTTIAQKNMDFIIHDGPGRKAFVRFWTLMANAIKQHPSAFALELMNEPASINRRFSQEALPPAFLSLSALPSSLAQAIHTSHGHVTSHIAHLTSHISHLTSHTSHFTHHLRNRRDMYDTWRAATEAVVSIIPDISVAVADTVQGPVLPGWVDELTDIIPLPYLSPSRSAVEWMQASNNVFYAWHYYGFPSTVAAAVKHAQGVSSAWNIPSFATEFMDCDMWDATRTASISHSYWHYSCYCDTNADFGHKKVPSQTFGACILGWGAGVTDRCT